MRTFAHRIPLGGMAASILFGVALVGCGSATGVGRSSATATPTCPATASFKSVSGRITTVGSQSATVSDASGATTEVQFTSTTRVTRILSLSPTALTVGASVVVLTDTNATVAKRISLVPRGATGTPGTPGTGFGSGRFSGTPPAGSNAACFRRTTPGAGSGQATGFQGLRGTVDSATSSQLVFDDAQGQTYSVAITSSTMIEQTAQAKTADLAVGMTVTATGSVTTNGISARTIAIQA
jgi:hypothetical protein